MKLDCIIYQIGQDLARTQRVADQVPRHFPVHLEQQRQALLFGFLGDNVQYVLQHLIEREGDAFEAQLSCFHLREIEDVVHDA